MKRNRWIVVLLVFSVLTACKKDTNNANTPQTEVKNSCASLTKFEKDSAYAHVVKQLSFGSRAPGTEAHANCADWFVEKLSSYGFITQIQEFPGTIFTGEKFLGKNIIASVNPEAKRRVLLCAHWDSRLWADKDDELKLHDDPIPGANDGASGVAVLLELARVYSKSDISLGVDIVLFDLEDSGENGADNLESWCIGSQHWSRNPHVANYRARFGILLDMVGAKNARFAKEQISVNYAGPFVDKTWRLAQALGHGNLFVNASGRGVTDDHYFVNTIRGIPTLDIIHTTSQSESAFFEHWHTMDDDIDAIDARSLGAVGEVLMNVLCREADGTF